MLVGVEGLGGPLCRAPQSGRGRAGCGCGGPTRISPPPSLVQLRGSVWFRGPSGQAGAKHAWSALRKVTRKQMHTHSPPTLLAAARRWRLSKPPPPAWPPRAGPCCRVLWRVVEAQRSGAAPVAAPKESLHSVEASAPAWKPRRCTHKAGRQRAHIRKRMQVATSSFSLFSSPKRTQAKVPDVYHAAGSRTETLWICPRWPGPPNCTQPEAI